MKRLEIYDPAMCCSSGVCGPTVNSALAEFQATLAALKNSEIEITRYNLGHQPQKFANNPQIIKAMGESAENLPIITLDGQIIITGRYPSKQELEELIDQKVETIS